MPDRNREEEIRELKSLRAELLAEYEDLSGHAEDSNTNEETEAILLRQSLFEDYEAFEENDEINGNKYVDEECNDEDEAPVKKLTRGRGL